MFKKYLDFYLDRNRQIRYYLIDKKLYFHKQARRFFKSQFSFIRQYLLIFIILITITIKMYKNQISQNNIIIGLHDKTMSTKWIFLIIWVWQVYCDPFCYNTSFTAEATSSGGGDSECEDGCSSSGTFQQVQFSPNGSHLAVATDGGVRIYDLSSVSSVYDSYSFDGKDPYCLSYSGDGKYLAVGYLSSSTVKVLNASTYNLVTSLSTSHSNVYGIDFNSDSTKLLTCGTNNRFIVWDTSTWSLLGANFSIGASVYDCKFATDDYVGIAISNSEVLVYDTTYTSPAVIHYNPQSGSGSAITLDFKPGSHSLFIMGSVDNDGYISSMGDVFLETADDVKTVSWNANGYYFAFGSKDNKVYMFEGIKNTMVHTFSFSNDVVAIDFSVDGNYFAAACSDLKVYLYYFCGNISQLVDSYDVSIGSGSTTTIIDRTCYLNETDLDGCSVCVNATACHVCIIGYYLTSVAECELCQTALDNCAICSSQSVCEECLVGYYVQSNACASCASAIDGCIVCADSSTCLSCHSDYYLNAGSCVECVGVNGCLKCLSSSQCVQCQIGYYLDSGACTACGQNCVACQSSTNCTACELMYYEDAGVCVSCGDNCLACTASDDCVSCVVGTYEDSGACVNCPLNCIVCDSDTVCRGCTIGFYLDAGSCVSCAGDYCAECTDADTCTNCLLGSYLDSDECHECGKVSIGCVACSSPSDCDVCGYGFVLIGDNSCQLCSESLEGCLHCSNITTCEQCGYGYHEENGVCVSCGQNCVSCEDNVTCNDCFPTHGLKENACVLCSSLIIGCRICEDENECKGCDVGYYQDNNTCTLCSVSMEGCMRCENEGICLECKGNYQINSSTCVEKKVLASSCEKEYCISCVEDNSTNATLCTQCLPTHFIDGSGNCQDCTSSLTKCLECSDSSTCTLCDLGYFVNSGSCSLCSSQIEGCLFCDSSSTCDVCQGGYEKSGSTCSKSLVTSTTATSCQLSYCISCVEDNSTNATLCTQCLPTHFIDGSGNCQDCTSSLTKCLECSDSSTCTLCDLGYFVNSGSCSLCSSQIEGCLFCDSSSTCDVCQGGYEKSGSTCSKSLVTSTTATSCQLSYCISCVEDNSTNATLCTQCLPTHFIDGSGNCQDCTSSLTKCLECSDSSTCTLCDLGYFVNSGSCSLCSSQIEGCLFCDSSSTCDVCQGGYEKSGSTCSKSLVTSTTATSCQLSYCISCVEDNSTNATLCTQCLPTHFIDGSGNCQDCTSSLTKCLECSDSSTCTLCDLGYFVNSGSCSLCSSQIEGCLFCDSSSTCDVCQGGYEKSGSTCSKSLVTSTTATSCQLSYCISCVEDNSTNATLCTQCLPTHFIDGSGNCQDCTSSLTKCLECSDSSTCTLCDLGYFVNSGSCSLCSSQIEGCLFCDSSSTCDVCQGGYEKSGSTCSKSLVTSTTATSCQLSYCISCVEDNSTNATLCTQCLPTHFIDGSGNCQDCTSSLTKCLECSDSSTCTLCDLGYFVNSGSCSLCSSQIEGCLFCDSSSTCDVCQGGYEKSGSTCSKSLVTSTTATSCQLSYCISCVEDNSTNATLCTQCLPTHFIDGSGNCQDCTSSLTKCLECSDSSTCTLCDLGYFVNSGSCSLCSSQIEGCLFCDSSSTCDVCQGGYEKSGSTCSKSLVTSTTATSCQLSYCISCVEDNSTNATLCTQCLPTHFIDGSGNCQDCTSSLTKCLECSDSSTCTLCDLGYFVNSGSCSLCSSQIEGCLFCDSSSTCDVCQGGYEKSGSTCSKSLVTSTTATSCQLSYCISCVEDNSTNATLCTQCLPTHFIDGSGNCQDCTSSLTKCLECSDSSTCTLCDLGYFVNSGSCSLCSSQIEGCLFCDSSSTCDVCQGGYEKSGSTCSKSLVTSTTATSCQLSYCISCVEDNSTNATLCTQCLPTHFIDGSGNCQDCTSSLTKCLECSDSSTCTLCDLGYFVNSGSCSLCSSQIEGCLFCDSSSTCDVCQGGYEKSGSTCSKSLVTSTTATSCQLSYCISCVEDNSTNATLCTQCLPTHFIDGSGNCQDCTSSLTKCLECSDSSTCTLCDLGYFVNSGSCSLCSSQIEGCLFCDSSSTCDVCQGGYEKSGSTCSKSLVTSTTATSCQLSYCISCVEDNSTNATLCTQCLPTHFIDGSGNCQDCTSSLTKCLECSDSSTCTLCDLGYFVNSGSCSLCSSQIEGCLFCDSSSTCDVCQGGYEKSGSTCSKSLVTSTTATSCQLSYCISCVEDNSTNATLCTQCLPTHFIDGSGNCQDCTSSLTKCLECSDSSTCTLCDLGYFVNSGSCSLCSSQIEGCLFCDSSSTCDVCQGGYEKSGSTCSKSLVTSTTATSCQLSYCISCVEDNSTNATLCTQCLPTHFIDGSGNCQDCTSSLTKCLECSDSSTCTLCDLGYFVNSGSCSLCSSQIEGCLFCDSSSTCDVCQGGYEKSGSTCSKSLVTSTTATSCQLSYCISCVEDNSTNATLCTQCLPTHFIDGSGNCQDCTSSLTKCLECSDSSTCTLCDLGYFVNSGSCSLCSSQIEGCLFCDSSSTCDVCQGGYEKSGSTCSKPSATNTTTNLCQLSYCISCQIDQFLSQFCTQCLPTYYLSSGLCAPCNSIQNCYHCSSSISCVLCLNGYILSSSRSCIPIKIQTQTSVEETVSYETKVGVLFKTYYIDHQNLKHILYSQGAFFHHKNLSWQKNVFIFLKGADKSTIKLQIKSAQYGDNGFTLVFYTDNPYQINQEDIEQMNFARRLLLSEQFEIQLDMTEQAVSEILPEYAELHSGSLSLDYSLDEPQFVATVFKGVNHYYYHIFGIIVTCFLFIKFSVKALVTVPKSFDKGQIIPHILALKCGALILFPIYLEYFDYCSGFMVADFPWANQAIGDSFSDSSDVQAPSYSVFYSNMNLASTYFLALIVISFLVFLSWLTGKSGNSEIKMKSYFTFLYCFFIFGCLFAGFASIQGAIYNPVSKLDGNTFFYLLGCSLYLVLLVQCLYSVLKKKKNNFWKVRVLIKATLLSLGHINPIFIVFIAFFFDILLAITEFKNQKEKSLKQFQFPYPKLWVINHILCNVSFLVLFYVSQSILPMLIISCVLVYVLTIEMLIHYYEIKKNRSKKILDDGEKERNNSSIKGLSDKSFQGNAKVDNQFFIDKEVKNFSFDQQIKQQSIGQVKINNTEEDLVIIDDQELKEEQPQVLHRKNRKKKRRPVQHLEEVYDLQQEEFHESP